MTASAEKQPLIGVFWLYRGKVIGYASPLATGKEYCPGLLDSQKNHTDLWDEDRRLLSDFPELRGQEYYSTPRGRVLWNKIDLYAIVYMDSTLFNDESKDAIVAFFDLADSEVKWKRDTHYTTEPGELTTIFNIDL